MQRRQNDPFNDHLRTGGSEGLEKLNIGNHAHLERAILYATMTMAR